MPELLLWDSFLVGGGGALCPCSPSYTHMFMIQERSVGERERQIDNKNKEGCHSSMSTTMACHCGVNRQPIPPLSVILILVHPRANTIHKL